MTRRSASSQTCPRRWPCAQAREGARAVSGALVLPRAGAASRSTRVYVYTIHSSFDGRGTSVAKVLTVHASAPRA